MESCGLEMFIYDSTDLKFKHSDNRDKKQISRTRAYQSKIKKSRTWENPRKTLLYIRCFLLLKIGHENSIILKQNSSSPNVFTSSHKLIEM